MERGEVADEKVVRDELTRLFDACGSCRACIDLCVTFPTLFELLDRPDTPDAGHLTPHEQDRVVDTCSYCRLCVEGCPGGAGPPDRGVDVPRSMQRAQAMRHATGQQPRSRRRATAFLGRADRIGRLATSMRAPVNALLAAPPRSMRRRVLAALTGVSSARRIVPYASQRWSSWMRSRSPAGGRPRRGSVTVHPTCVVEYQDVAHGRDLVDVYEHAGIGCEPSTARCCGAPWLHVGDVSRFARVAERNVAVLAEEIRRHGEVVVAQPACAHVIRRDYPAHLATAESQFVAAHTHDAAAYLAGALEDVDGTAAASGTAAATPCTALVTSAAVRPGGGSASALLERVGFGVSEVRRCSGTDGLWGLCADHDDVVDALGDELRRRAASDDAVVADGPLVAALVAEDRGPRAVGPFLAAARRLGLVQAP